jgi:hypothetical protein
LAIWPTSLSPFSVKPTTEGVKREPEALIKVFGAEPSITATTENVVPKSIPMVLAMLKPFRYKHYVIPVKTGIRKDINTMASRLCGNDKIDISH